MAKKAFCVGINDYPYEGNDLNGCVNDANAWAELLTNNFGFPSSNVTIITDAEATKSNIIAGIKELLADAKSDDVLVFTNSSHGSYIADTSGDEPTYDEIICPYDIADNVVADDELRELFDGLAKGVRLTVISDSCFSGTVTRAAVNEIIPGFRTPDDRRVRFLNPALRGDKIVPDIWNARPKRSVKHPQSKMKELLISGCTDKEYSYDALIEGVYHGAMTYFALKAIRDANYKITYAQLLTRMRFMLDQAGYPQHPQLEGKYTNKKRQVFT
ncbi:MAG: caspase family protein [Candidatus Brocadia sp.]|nr:caspase family protein [Candidatus Brocadia sp.]